MQLQDSVALVTGGLSGLGRATAQKLASQAKHVLVLDLPRDDGDEIAAQIGANVRFVPADVTDAQQVATAIERAKELGTLRVLVNCAGVATPGKVLGREGVLPLERFSKVLEINVNGTFNVIRLAAEAMAHSEAEVDEHGTSERGVIINTASVAAFDGQIGQPAYAASKGAVAAMTLPLARELASHQIRVMTIAPGIFHTPMMAGLPQAAQDSLGAQVPHPSRLGRPEEYAALVEHIVANPMLNGETIRLDGAIRMAPR
ncbi:MULTISPECIES: 3-hydroxyacyl-CoA dehydrogenase [Glutamicibacter]|jgi:NAD(P)-dependent dehydrogenase (short-subunit alcohol dehydrogenase family)|uniref:3-hydroxyacyl-CoA dehydrogenase n=1 Tax=Glutamicibacter arilaitensis TaxID=256701 RepID=A0A4Y8TSZ7_9MICC|nr:MULTISPECIES: 3-hydroxyacyl-CoA dehydrogenase [Glutamicibacter]TFH54493.1 3-hydroxyacyl-CoA dehydrogenase [Glutamicibacter arilaitensis]HCJ53918.1 3-hydroxyacyl-CoA dehydrogenase [Glutamicibacter sp.]HCM94565.1 3-hydroxyacyl-CoA dehydrogenase [Glutamicibacter sp.]